jgi:hypothetical protein
MLKALLKDRRKAIIKRWFCMIVDTYPPGSREFLLQKNEKFANPVGSTLHKEINILYDELLSKTDLATISSSFENINKIRAVQDFTASQAVAYIFSLKIAIREVLADDLLDNDILRQLLEIDSRIDGMALISFDTYMQCREKLFEIKCSDIRRKSALHISDSRKFVKNSTEEDL